MINWVCSDYFELVDMYSGRGLVVARLSPGTDDAVIYVGNSKVRITTEHLGQFAEALTKLYGERE